MNKFSCVISLFLAALFSLTLSAATPSENEKQYSIDVEVLHGDLVARKFRLVTLNQAEAYGNDSDKTNYLSAIETQEKNGESTTTYKQDSCITGLSYRFTPWANGSENLLDIKFKDVVLVEMKKLNGGIENPNVETLTFNKKVPFSIGKPLAFDIGFAHVGQNKISEKVALKILVNEIK